MACRLIIKTKLKVIQYTFLYFYIFISEKFCQPLTFLLTYFPVNNNNRIIQVTAFNQVISQQSLNLTQKNKSPARCYFLGKISILERIRSILHRQIRRVV